MQLLISHQYVWYGFFFVSTLSIIKFFNFSIECIQNITMYVCFHQCANVFFFFFDNFNKDKCYILMQMKRQSIYPNSLWISSLYECINFVFHSLFGSPTHLQNVHIHKYIYKYTNTYLHIEYSDISSVNKTEKWNNFLKMFSFLTRLWQIFWRTKLTNRITSVFLLHIYIHTYSDLALSLWSSIYIQSSIANS